MEEKKYLYYYGHYTDNNLYRSEVTRETDANIWIKLSNDGELRISKKTYRTGDTWNSTHYYNETPEILEKFKLSRLKRVFKKKLEDLKKCEDIEIMKKVIAIKNPDIEIV